MAVMEPDEDVELAVGDDEVAEVAFGGEDGGAVEVADVVLNGGDGVVEFVADVLQGLVQCVDLVRQTGNTLLYRLTLVGKVFRAEVFGLDMSVVEAGNDIAVGVGNVEIGEVVVHESQTEVGGCAATSRAFVVAADAYA